MSERLRAILTMVRMRFAENLFWVRIGAATVLVAGTGLWAGIATHRQADATGRRAAELERTLESADAWIRDFHPATPAESASWRRSERAVEELAVAASDRAMLAELIARRADDLGIADVRVRIESTDTLVSSPLVVGTRSFGMAPAALAVEIGADYADLIRFLGFLPPQVQARRIDIVRGEDGLRMVVFLTMYAPAGGTASHAT